MDFFLGRTFANLNFYCRTYFVGPTSQLQFQDIFGPSGRAICAWTNANYTRWWNMCMDWTANTQINRIVLDHSQICYKSPVWWMPCVLSSMKLLFEVNSETSFWLCYIVTAYWQLSIRIDILNQQILILPPKMKHKWLEYQFIANEMTVQSRDSSNT